MLTEEGFGTPLTFVAVIMNTHFVKTALCGPGVFLLLNAFKLNSHISVLWRWTVGVFSTRSRFCFELYPLKLKSYVCLSSKKGDRRV